MVNSRWRGLHMDSISSSRAEGPGFGAPFSMEIVDQFAPTDLNGRLSFMMHEKRLQKTNGIDDEQDKMLDLRMGTDPSYLAVQAALEAPSFHSGDQTIHPMA